MKFTINWLKRHLDITAEMREIIGALNRIGLEVEEVIDYGQIYSNFIVAEIIEAYKHPNSDKLTICKVNDGQDILQIVCGAPNARSGIKVVLAKIGAVIPGNNLVIKKSVIRDIESHGMLCSYDEIAMPGDNHGIIELSHGEIGSSISDIFRMNDVMIEISITPNRGDCASVLGIARDLAACDVGVMIKQDHPQYNVDFQSHFHIHLNASDMCRSISFVHGKNVDNSVETQKELAEHLKQIGYDAKSALVDISNFIMFDMGRPNHIYDADKIIGDIIIRQSHDNESFTAIGGLKYTLPSGLLVIADQEKILSLAGVIGGEESKVTHDTKNILIEVADFDSHAVLASGRALDINTDSRFRFERHIDHSSTDLVLNMLVQYIRKCAGGAFSQCMLFKGDYNMPRDVISFASSAVERISGLKLTDNAIFSILSKLGFNKINNDAKDNIHIPSWRIWDIANEPDIVEEVIRIYGLENIVEQPLPYYFTNKSPQSNDGKIRDRLLHRNMNEVISWSFTNRKIANSFVADEALLEIDNPISPEMSVMRPSIICSMIPILQRNIARSIKNVNIFEMGCIYSDTYQANQMRTLTGMRSGFIVEKNVHAPCRHVDFFDVKDDALSIISEYIDVKKLVISGDSPHYYHPTRGASLRLGKVIVAYFGELHPKMIKDLELDVENVYCFEVFLDKIPQTKISRNRQISDYQSVTRDFAFVVNDEMHSIDLINEIHAMKIALIESVDIIDVYTGKGVEDGFKSITVSVKIQPQRSTLKDEEIDGISREIIGKLSASLGVTLRA